MSWTKKLGALVLAAGTLAGGATASRAAALTPGDQSLIPIAAFTASGNTERLKGALEDGLKNGLTISEIKDELVQMYAYTGFPRSLTALSVFMNLLNERRAQGITDTAGREKSPVPQDRSVLERGTDTQTAIVGHPVKGPLFEFSPDIDRYLKTHLFGDIFDSDLLTHKQRELATVSALAALPAPAQLASHLSCAMVVGLTEAQLRELAATLRSQVGGKEADLTEKTLDEILKKKNQTK